MSILDAELQKELIAFVEAESKNKQPKKLKESLVAELVRQLINGDREITGMVTNQKTGDVFVRFSFKQEIENIPVAYNVDKVVEQLKEARDELLHSTDYNNDIINYCLDWFDMAIDIVKGGGQG